MLALVQVRMRSDEFTVREQRLADLREIMKTEPDLQSLRAQAARSSAVVLEPGGKESACIDVNASRNFENELGGP